MAKVAVRKTQFIPSQVSGLRLWLRSDVGLYTDAGITPCANDGDLVYQWQDQSGYAHHATQTTSAQRPGYYGNVENGLPAVRWSANGHNMTFGDPATLQITDSTTIIFVYRVTTASTSTLLGQGATAGAFQLQAGVAADNSGSRSARVIGTGNAASASLAIDDSPLNAFEIFVYRRDGSGVRHLMYRNGSARFLNTNVDTSYSANGTKILGAISAFSAPLKGDIAEVLIYDNAISLDNLDSLHTYLMTRYGLTWMDDWLLAETPTFTWAVVGDLHGAATNGERIKAIWQWLKFRMTRFNIGLAMSPGDFVNVPTDVLAWEAADRGLTTLDAAQIAYVLAPGNHDYDAYTVAPYRAATIWNTYITQARYQARSWWNGGFYEVGNSINCYTLLTLGGIDFIVFALEHNPRQAVLDWVAALLTTYASRDAMIVTHDFTQSDDTLSDHGDSYIDTYGGLDYHTGQEVWDEVVDLSSNVIWVQNGHTYAPDNGSANGYIANVADDLHTVHCVHFNLQNYPALVSGKDLYIRLMMYYAGTPATVKVFTLAPSNGCLRLNDADNEFTVAYKP